MPRAPSPCVSSATATAVLGRRHRSLTFVLGGSVQRVPAPCSEEKRGARAAQLGAAGALGGPGAPGPPPPAPSKQGAPGSASALPGESSFRANAGPGRQGCAWQTRDVLRGEIARRGRGDATQHGLIGTGGGKGPSSPWGGAHPAALPSPSPFPAPPAPPYPAGALQGAGSRGAVPEPGGASSYPPGRLQRGRGCRRGYIPVPGPVPALSTQSQWVGGSGCGGSELPALA